MRILNRLAEDRSCSLINGLFQGPCGPGLRHPLFHLGHVIYFMFSERKQPVVPGAHTTLSKSCRRSIPTIIHNGRSAPFSFHSHRTEVLDELHSATMAPKKSKKGSDNVSAIASIFSFVRV